MADVSQLLESRRLRLGRWTGAALVVCALHVGGAALALMQWPEDEAADSAAGALTVELAALPAPAPVDSQDVAPGPEREEARQRQEAAKQVVKEVEEEMPPVEPSPAPEPEVALPKPQPDENEQKEEEEAREATAKEDVPQPDDFDQEEAAPPPVDAQPAPSSAAAPGQSADAARVLATWQEALSRHLERFKRYPRAARRRGLEGGAIVRFVLDRSGQVIAAEISKSSGSPILDKEALDTLRRASPLPAPPAEVPDKMLEGVLPFDFHMEK